jgi:MoaA/NifB/PqqE/SkfB family radical SAM enzyme/alpha-beta hydrolase superfamily lysophospholipase
MPAGFLLVHGYTGSPRDLAPLADLLARRFGPSAVRTVPLPGHDQALPPPFDPTAFVGAIGAAAEALAREHPRIVLIGHSTGGTLALTAVAQEAVRPALLVLAATPHGVDGNALERWERHRSGRPALALPEVARMVRHINQVKARPAPAGIPLLLLDGDRDALVPATDGDAWARQGFETVRRLTLPGAGHALFAAPGGPAAADWIARQAEDLLHPADPSTEAAAERLAWLEGPRLRHFFRIHPQARRHLVSSPAGRTALAEGPPALALQAPEPIQLNIEVTTRCNLACPRCARTRQGRAAADMDPARFRYLLDMLPQAWRVVLAGLGEPTLHPQLPELVAMAAGRGRLVHLVTNATVLAPDLFEALAAAGLGAVTFSLDGADPSVAAGVRPGADVASILANIRAGVPVAAAHGMATAVFTVVSAHNLPHLPRLAEAVAALGVQAWMLTDINFPWNQPHSTAKTLDAAGRGAIRQALRTAFARQLPVLGIQGLEGLALAERYREFLLYPPERLGARSPVRTHCLSPWQTLPVDVAGRVSVCDCNPALNTGDLGAMPFSEIWNGSPMQAWRRDMLSAEPPEACRACPRF